MGIESIKDESKNSAVVHIRGDFNFSMNAEFREVLDSVAEVSSEVIINMSMANEIDSSALGMLLLFRDKYGKKENKIRIVKCKKGIHDILLRANFQNLFDIDEL